jgi:hypothetical protein
MVMSDCLVVRQHRSSPEQIDVIGALITDFSKGDKTALVTCRHNKTPLVLSAPWRLMSHYTSLRTTAEQWQCSFWTLMSAERKLIL